MQKLGLVGWHSWVYNYCMCCGAIWGPGLAGKSRSTCTTAEAWKGMYVHHCGWHFIKRLDLIHGDLSFAFLRPYSVTAGQFLKYNWSISVKKIWVNSMRSFELKRGKKLMNEDGNVVLNLCCGLMDNGLINLEWTNYLLNYYYVNAAISVPCPLIVIGRYCSETAISEMVQK